LAAIAPPRRIENFADHVDKSLFAGPAIIRDPGQSLDRIQREIPALPARGVQVKSLRCKDFFNSLDVRLGQNENRGSARHQSLPNELAQRIEEKFFFRIKMSNMSI